MLTKRLQSVIDHLIDKSQSAFVPRCMLNIDMQKAYDSVEWTFLEQVLNFLAKYVDWIMICMTNVSYSILINRIPSPPFPAKKGPRQGDPLSPFLFVLTMEYLNRHLRTLRHNPDFNYHPKCSKLQIIQLGFADDLLLFCRGDVISVQLLFGCFSEFSMCSGLIANIEKSSIFFGGIGREEQNEIMNILGYSKGELPIKYLEVPLSSKRLSVTQCYPLVDKMIGRITSWTAKYLSYAGKLQLIKNVLFCIQAFWSHVFILPKKIVHMIETACRSFLWAGQAEVTKKAPLAWEKVCCSKTAGGFNVIHIETWNKAAVSKLLWNLCTKRTNYG